MRQRRYRILAGLWAALFAVALLVGALHSHVQSSPEREDCALCQQSSHHPALAHIPALSLSAPLSVERAGEISFSARPVSRSEAPVQNRGPPVKLLSVL